MIFKIFILLSTFFISLLSAESINITFSEEPINILKQTEIYVDKENRDDFKCILENNKNLFKANEKELLHFGYSSNVIWLKFSIKNPSNSEVNKVLEISNQMLDNIFLYTKVSDSNYTKEENGILHKNAFNENIFNMYFNISMKPGETKEYYLKVSSLSCALYFKANLISKDKLYKKEINHQLILALFFSSIITLIIYNIFIYYFTKDRAYLYYVLYLAFTTLEHLSYTLFNLYIYPRVLYDIDTHLTIFYISSLLIFAILFTREFLNVKKYKKIDSIFKAIIILNIIFIVLSALPAFYPLELVVSLGMLAFIYLIGVSFYLLYVGERNAKYMIIGWSISVFGWVMQGSYDSGSWSLINTYPYFFEIAIFTEAILFSVALANKLNTTKELKKSVQTNKILTKELHHRVKNNMQFIISMYRLKLAKFSNRDISDSLKEVEGTIQAMSATHEMLYSQEMNSIDTKDYFTTLTESLKNSYNTAKVDINLNITTDLNIDDSIYVGIILNELLTNSFKYAFENNSGEIKISLSKRNGNYELIVSDNGAGFDVEKETNTFGIELIKALVHDELNGKVTINAKSGCKYTIVWR